jgi:hypothetical protein
MNSRSQRRVIDDPVPELVTPLSGPSYGPFNVARQRWRKSLPAIIADAIVCCEGLNARLVRGFHVPDMENKPYYDKVFKQLSRATDEHLAALKAFAAISWRE